MSKTAELLQNQFEELQMKYEEQMILLSSLHLLILILLE
jgi:hypothetical protein